jgi:transcriptional regulator with XRE-family HTH domain
MTIGQKIIMLRDEKGLSQDKAAKVAGVSLRVWFKIEQEVNNNVKLDTLRKIAAAFELTLSQLLEGVT